MENEFGNDIFTLTDDDGNESEFEVLSMTEHNGGLYAAMLPVYDDSQEFLDSDGEFWIFKINEMENGDIESLEIVEDETLLNELVDVFNDLLDEEFELDN